MLHAIPILYTLIWAS